MNRKKISVMALSNSKNSGLSLVEVLVTMAIIAVLVAISFAVVERVRRSSDRTVCVSNLRALGVAVQAYTLDNDGCLPPGSRPNMGGTFNRILSAYTVPMKSTTMSADVFYCPANVRLGAPPMAGYPSGTGYKGWSGYFFNYLLNTSVFKITNPDLTSSTYVPDENARVRLNTVQSPTKTIALMDLPTPKQGVSSPPTSALANRNYFDPEQSSFSLGLIHGGLGNVLFLDGHVEAFGKTKMPVISLPDRSETWW